MSTIAAGVATTGHEKHVSDYIGAKVGMWLFLFTELLLFGGLFLVYSVYRAMYHTDFHTAAKELNVTLGAVNTIILLTSSLTMACSISATQRGNRKLSILLLVMTALFGIAFLVNKYFEWGAKFQHGIYPGSDQLGMRENGEILFYGLYYMMTGLHGLHVIVGVLLFSVVLLFLVKKKIHQENFVLIENSGLYWHLVDIIWIFLFPLFYLIT
ncbi:MAG: cytochrome c oxidase subunit 3 [Armatimonadetes bacterium]|nr:cytochrome c oxidase subunit 3 [Armatimonadota bacterium]